MISKKPRPSLSEAVYLQVARDIRNQIQAGRLRHGEVLPSTRELAAKWDTSVYTVNQAMGVLAGEGLVINQSRSKRVVNAPDTEAPVAWRPAVPQVLLVGGYPGSGKSELGRILARQSGWPILDKDTLTRPVVEIALEVLGQSPHDRESPVYLDKVRPGEYESLAAATLENVECGNSAIVTAPFLREFADQAWLSRTSALFETHGAVTTVVWLYCDASTMQRYMRQRGAARDSYKIADWDGYLSGIDLEFRPSVPHHVVDNSASSSPLQNQARTLIDSILSNQA